jgi:P-type Cu+ transporter
MESIAWKVEGMTCSNCALSVSKYLTKQGFSNVQVNPITGEVQFNTATNEPLETIKAGIKKLGYHVLDDNITGVLITSKSLLSTNKSRFLFCLPFTLILMLHMLPDKLHIHFLMQAWVQIILCLPVFFVGMYFFGRSAVKSITHGTTNMNVLITVGALAAFIYSMVGVLLNWGHNYYFFETTATIITLVFFGNYLEEATIQKTQIAINSLTVSQKVMANMIAFDDKHEEQYFPIENKFLKSGDLVLIKTGEEVPADCKILFGNCTVNEAIITGESAAIEKQKKDFLIGGSIIENGLVKAQVTADFKTGVLSGIVKMVQNAQAEKPALQKLADKISAVFVPLVLAIAAFTFILNYFFLHIDFSNAIMRSIAVLVISCPCAMGLATPAAIAVGLGRAAKNGILFKHANTLQHFKKIKHVVFDKTGTLTTGNLTIHNFETTINEIEFKTLIYNLEKFTNHPIAKTVLKFWKTNTTITFKKIEEVKGVGVVATDLQGNNFELGSYKLLQENNVETIHNIYLLKNKICIGWIDLADELRPEAKQVIDALQKHNITTHILSGDHISKCQPIADALGIKSIFASQSPAEKMSVIDTLNKTACTVMVGDGINDAAALAKASIGITLSDAANLTVQNADIVLLNNGLKNLPLALGLGKHTNKTIYQNLGWAFAYNIVAIPIAIFGLLTPTFAALAMGFSDVVLGLNSIWLFKKKVL